MYLLIWPSNSEGYKKISKYLINLNKHQLHALATHEQKLFLSTASI